MDLNEHIQKIVDGLVQNISSKVEGRIDEMIVGLIEAKLSNFDYTTHVQTAASLQLEKKVSEYNLDSKKLETRIIDKINLSIDRIESASAQNATIILNERLSNLDLNKIMENSLSAIIDDRLKFFTFPENSINARALNFSNSKISGDSIEGGIINNFSSTGIDDRATNIALTILDEATVVENNLLTKDLTVHGAMTINGSFIVNGSVPTDSLFYKNLVDSSSSTTLSRLDTSLFNQYSDLIFNKIKNEGIDLSTIKIHGKEIIKENSLSSIISQSNLQKLGVLKELQVSGESMLSETLYTTSKRVGINTIEPSAALSVWDDEVEFTISKKQKDTAQIGVPRQQRLVISSNAKENLSINPDGSVTAQEIKLGSIKFTSSESPPNFVSEKGHVVWNANPSQGGPIGWVCLGSANWANFGIID